MLVTVIPKTLHLKHAFTISRGSKTKNEGVFVSVRHNGIEGWGEASPNIRYGESAGACMVALAVMIDQLKVEALEDPNLLRKTFDAVEGEFAAKAALDMAIMDHRGKTLNKPMYEVWGLDPKKMKPSGMTIPIASPEVMAQRALEASDFPCLKVKVGGPSDRAMIQAIRSKTRQPIRVDANEGWTDRKKALADIQWLADNGVEVVEQPMPAAQHKDMIWLKERSPLPLIADEAFTSPESIKGLAEAYHGINIKLQKCGGTLAARESIKLARDLGMTVMIGCMVESSLAIAAASHLAPDADYLDLDGHLFLSEDPFQGVTMVKGTVQLGREPGFGVTPTEYMSLPDTEGDTDIL